MQNAQAQIVDRPIVALLIITSTRRHLYYLLACLAGKDTVTCSVCDLCLLIATHTHTYNLDMGFSPPQNRGSDFTQGSGFCAPTPIPVNRLLCYLAV